MDFRVTVGLGQESVDVEVLDARAGALQQSLSQRVGGQGATVVVDLVKAALQVVLPVDAGDGVLAASAALELTAAALHDADLGAPNSIVTVEAEAVPEPAHDAELRPHAVPGH